MTPTEDPATFPYRVRKLEEKQDEMRTQTIPDLLSQGRGWHGAIMVKIAEVDRQLSQLQLHMDDRFAPRREAEARHQAINERFDALDRVLRAGREEERDWIRDNKERIERLERAAWGLAVAVLIVALGAWVRTGGPH